MKMKMKMKMKMMMKMMMAEKKGMAPLITSLHFLKRIFLFLLFLSWACFCFWTSSTTHSASFASGYGRFIIASPENEQKFSSSSYGSDLKRSLKEAVTNVSTNAAQGKGSSCKDCGETKACAGVSDETPALRCDYARKNCRGSNKSNINYVALHYCALNEQTWLSAPLLLFGVLLSFIFLTETAENHFSPVAQTLVEVLNMSPSMGGVTLLALGNGAPDVFGSLAAILGGNPRIGIGAILSAGTFVSAFVVGCVAMVAAPFSVKPGYFVRDVVFYTVAAGFLFSLYRSGVVHFWQALGLVFFYLFFVVVVIFTDLVRQIWKLDEMSHFFEENELSETGSVGENFYVESIEHSYIEGQTRCNRVEDTGTFEEHSLLCERTGRRTALKESQLNHSFMETLLSCTRLTSLANSFSLKHLLFQLLRVKATFLNPVQWLLKVTIPASDPAQWNRLYTTTSIFLCPVALMVMFQEVIPFDHQIDILLLNLQLPLWFLVLVQGTALACAYYLETKQQPKSAHVLLLLLAFVMSVFWISFIAGELLSFLAALGVLLHVPAPLLGLTVLAWGNSVGDLVADVAVARAGQPQMAIAGCYAGPMFNMLLGLGSALAINTAQSNPPANSLLYHPSIMIAFGFLFLTLLGSLLVVTYSNFQVTKTWGMCLIGIYVTFTVVSLSTATIII